MGLIIYQSFYILIITYYFLLSLPNSDCLETSIPAEPSIKRAFQDISIRNLNSFLDLFNQCQIHVLNYKAINFNPINLAVVLSGFHYINNGQILSYDGKRIKNINKIVGSRPRIFFSEICQVQFHLFPPKFQSIYSSYSYGSYLPQHYEIGPIYNIFLYEDTTPFEVWSETLDNILNAYSQHDNMILWANIRNTGTIELEISQAFLQCKYCHPSYTTYVPLRLENLLPINNGTLLKIHTEFRKMNKVNNGVPWECQSSDITLNSMLEDQNKRRDIDWSIFGLRGVGRGIPIDLILFKTVLPNGTLRIGSRYRTSTRYTQCMHDQLSTNSGIVCTMMSPSINFQSQEWASALPRGEDKYTFLACGQQETAGITFLHFILPFDSSTWIGIIGFYGGLAVFIWCLSKIFIKRMKLKTKINSLQVFLGMRMLIRQASDLPRKQKLAGFMYWICGAWMLMAIILTSVYRDINVAFIMAPRTLSIPMYFEEIVDRGFKIYSKINFSPYPEDDFSLIKLIKNQNMTVEYEFEMMQGLYCEYQYQCPAWSRNKLDLQLISNSKRPESIVVNDVEVLMQCDNVAIVGQYQNYLRKIQNEMRSVYHRTVSLGWEPLAEYTIGWDIQSWGDPDVPQRLTRLYESGISEELARFEKEITGGTASDFVTHVSVLNMNGNIMSIFYALAIGLISSFGGLLLENMFFFACKFLPKSVKKSVLKLGKCGPTDQGMDDKDGIEIFDAATVEEGSEIPKSNEPVEPVLFATVVEDSVEDPVPFATTSAS